MLTFDTFVHFEDTEHPVAVTYNYEPPIGETLMNPAEGPAYIVVRVESQSIKQDIRHLLSPTQIEELEAEAAEHHEGVLESAREANNF